jgi:hypothetical protein
MEYIYLYLLLVSQSLSANETKTDLFTIDLPKSFKVETNKRSRLLAFGDKGPSHPPFLSIEFGKVFPIKDVKERVNSVLKENEISLQDIDCGNNCKAYYAEQEINVDGNMFASFHYLASNERLGFIISYTDNKGIKMGGEFVKSIANQLLSINN